MSKLTLDTNESLACHSGNSYIILTARQRTNIHREEATKVPPSHSYLIKDSVQND
jgi:hypothetical protein